MLCDAWPHSVWSNTYPLLFSSINCSDIGYCVETILNTAPGTTKLQIKHYSPEIVQSIHSVKTVIFYIDFVLKLKYLAFDLPVKQEDMFVNEMKKHFCLIPHRQRVLRFKIFTIFHQRFILNKKKFNNHFS